MYRLTVPYRTTPYLDVPLEPPKEIAALEQVRPARDPRADALRHPPPARDLLMTHHHHHHATEHTGPNKTKDVSEGAARKHDPTREHTQQKRSCGYL